MFWKLVKQKFRPQSQNHSSTLTNRKSCLTQVVMLFGKFTTSILWMKLFWWSTAPPLHQRQSHNQVGAHGRVAQQWSQKTLLLWKHLSRLCKSFERLDPKIKIVLPKSWCSESALLEIKSAQIAACCHILLLTFCNFQLSQSPPPTPNFLLQLALLLPRLSETRFWSIGCDVGV